MPSASAMQASLPDWMMTPCSRSSTATLLWIGTNMLDVCEGAPPVRQALSLTMNSSVELEPALLDLVEHHLGGHQLGQAGGRHEFVGALLEQHAAAVGIDQDRVRSRGLKAALAPRFWDWVQRRRCRWRRQAAPPAAAMRGRTQPRPHRPGQRACDGAATQFVAQSRRTLSQPPPLLSKYESAAGNAAKEPARDAQ